MIDLSILIGFVTLTKFSMEMVLAVLGSIRKGDVMFSIDLKDAYFQMPVHLESRPYVRFLVQGTVYHVQELCFRVSTAPQVFIRVQCGKNGQS